MPGLVYGYEEALGYCVDPEAVRDKDGVTAALLVAELAAGLKAEGRTLLDLLDDLARAHGLHATDQLSVRFADLDEIPAAMDRLRSADAPSSAVSRCCRSTTSSVGSARPAADRRAALPPRRRRLGGLVGRVVVRPSGTEPKLKGYLEVVLPVPGRRGRPHRACAVRPPSARCRASPVAGRRRPAPRDQGPAPSGPDPVPIP